MRPYIETTRAMMVNGHMRVLDILSLPLIVKHITQVADYLKKLAQQPLHKILFVGTKFPAK